MTTVSEKFADLYLARREMSEPSDLARLFLARLLYSNQGDSHGLASAVSALESGEWQALKGSGRSEFAEWLRGYLVLGRRTRGVSYYPIHPVLTQANNGEESRCDGFVAALASRFSVEERRQLLDTLWGQLPPFERAVYDLIDWQVGTADVPAVAAAPGSRTPAGLAPTALAILDDAREDLLALASQVEGVQSYTGHAGRLLALALTRFWFAQAGIDPSFPTYTGPAADSHDGVRTLAHEIIEVHRSLFEQALKSQFARLFGEAATELSMDPDPADAAAARTLTKTIFHHNANVVPLDGYDSLRQEHKTLSSISLDYYWQSGGAASRFLRQLYAAYLNQAKKAGIANSRSQYSTWHYYWLAPSLIETLLLVTRPRLGVNRLLLVDLLADWRQRYGLTVFVDEAWQDAYRASFRGLGDPESLNEANRRRLNEILSERGRLHKNSDDFPWVILKD
jgi:hypothetical protein